MEMKDKASGGFESQIVHQFERKRSKAKSNKSNHDGPNQEAIIEPLFVETWRNRSS